MRNPAWGKDFMPLLFNRTINSVDLTSLASLSNPAFSDITLLLELDHCVSVSIKVSTTNMPPSHSWLLYVLQHTAGERGFFFTPLL